MHNLSLEIREYKEPMARDLVEDIIKRSSYGKIVVATKNPIASLSAVRKQWLRAIRHIEKERASTLKAERIRQLSSELLRLNATRFGILRDLDSVDNLNVIFATANDLASIAPPCTTLYVTYKFPREQIYLMTSWMQPKGLVVFYDPL